MLLELIKKLNWVDLFVIIAFVRIGYISFKTGFTIEFFKLLGVFAAVYVSLHYYTLVSDIAFRGTGAVDKMPLEFTDLISLVLLVVLTYLIFVFIRSIFYRFIKMEAAPNLQKWGGLVLGMLRAFLFSSLIVFMLLISSFEYCKNSVKDSYCGASILKIAPSTYSWLWNSVSSKFMNSEKFNNAAIEVEKEVPQK